MFQGWGGGDVGPLETKINTFQKKVKGIVTQKSEQNKPM